MREDVRDREFGSGLSLSSLASFLAYGLPVIGTWLMLFMFLAAATEGWLVPWDTTPIRPPIGTWEHTVNDFFEGTPGSLLPSIVTVGASMSVFLLRLRRTTQRGQLALFFAATNFLSLVAMVPAIALGWGVANLVFPQNEPGFHRTLLPAVASSAVLVGLLIVQARVGLEKANTHTGPNTK